MPPRYWLADSLASFMRIAVNIIRRSSGWAYETEPTHLHLLRISQPTNFSLFGASSVFITYLARPARLPPTSTTFRLPAGLGADV